MKLWWTLFLLGIPSGAPVIHSLKYFYTTSTEVPNFPEFVAVSYVDEVQMFHYDSNTMRAESKQDWMREATDEKYWEEETEIARGNQQAFKAGIEILKQRFNQTGDVHLYQNMYGCEWDDETDEVNGFDQRGYDGEDFIVFDLKTETFIAPNPKAVITKHKWDNNKAYIAQLKHYFTEICPEWLKKYVKHGWSSLMRTELPSVSLLQRTPSSPLRCHATGFYPDRAHLFWSRDGEELHEEVVRGEILPNHDGTFQMSVDLELSAVQAADWGRYDCVFQLSGVKDDYITKLDKERVKTNWPKEFSIAAIVGVVVALIVLAGCVLVGVLIWRNKPACLSGFQRANTSETSSSSDDQDMKKVSVSSSELVRT